MGDPPKRRSHKSPSPGAGNGPGQTGSEGPGDASFASLIGEVARFDPVSRPGSDRRPPRPRRPRNAGAQPRFLFPDPFEPRFGRARDCPERVLRRLWQGDPAPAERIDLHGLDRERAQRQLGRSLESAAAREIACVLVIHGVGRSAGDAGGVLRELLPGWLTSGRCGKTVRAFAPARQRDGGDGATYVLLARG